MIFFTNFSALLYLSNKIFLPSISEKDTMDVWCNGEKIETAVSKLTSNMQKNQKLLFENQISKIQKIKQT